MMGQPDPAALAEAYATARTQGRGTAMEVHRKQLAALGCDVSGKPVKPPAAPAPDPAKAGHAAAQRSGAGTKQADPPPGRTSPKDRQHNT
jgi:hypothetical protein